MANNKNKKSESNIYSEVEKIISATASNGIRPGLERISRLLELLNNPQNNWPAFHVVGTNGKGSTCAYIESVLRTSGYKTALYTSPHLESPAERLLINHEPLKGVEWLDAVNKIAEIIKSDEILSQDAPSYFEIITAAAFLLMSNHKIDVAVVEAGLGGRLDATNLLGRVVCSVIASISMDHMEFLGDTLDKIAAEKFAVVKANTPACFLGDSPSLINLFKSFCEANNAVPFVVSENTWLDEVTVSDTESSFNFNIKLNDFKNLSLNNLKIHMIGRYQLSNASLALSAISLVLKNFPNITLKNIADGMQNARWPGRLEIINNEPVIVLDGGHNKDGVIKLVQSAAELWDGKKIGVVYAAMRDKDYSGCLEILNTLNNAAFYATAVPEMQRCLPENEMLKAAKKFSWRNDKKLKAFNSPLDAVKQALKDDNDIILICGSLYLIGWIRPRIRSRKFNKNNKSKSQDSDLSANSHFKEIKKTEKINKYKNEIFATVEMMALLQRGLAPMGMLFILMDVLRGHEEGIINVSQLAQALKIDRTTVWSNLEIIEKAGFIRTISRSNSGRHIELLVHSLLKTSRGEAQGLSVLPYGISGDLYVPADNEAEVGGKFSKKSLKFLLYYLKNNGVELSFIPDSGNENHELQEIASYIGKYLEFIKPFYSTLKTTLSDCAEFSFSLAKRSSREVTHIMNLCKMLKDSGLFADYEHQKAPRYRIVARVSKLSGAVNFLSGGWLEYYIRDKVISILTTHPATLTLPYAFLKNARGTLPNGENCEFDFLLCVGEKIFWLEAKTGEYISFLQRYSRISKVLKLNHSSAMLVSVEPISDENNLTAKYNMSCCSVDEFPDVFRLNLVRELQKA